MAANPVDYDVHGAAGVRLLDASAADAAAVDRQLGPIRAPLRGEPDIVVRFVDALATSGPLRLLGVGEAAFTDDAFLLLRSRHKARARVRVDLATVGSSATSGSTSPPTARGSMASRSRSACGTGTSASSRTCGAAWDAGSCG